MVLCHHRLSYPIITTIQQVSLRSLSSFTCYKPPNVSQHHLLSETWHSWTVQNGATAPVDLSRRRKKSEKVPPSNSKSSGSQIEKKTKDVIKESPIFHRQSLSFVINHDFPLIDDRVRIEPIHRTLQGLGDLKSVVKSASALSRLGHPDRARYLLRTVFQGISFASVQDISSACRVLVELLRSSNIPDKASPYSELLNGLFSQRRGPFLQKPTTGDRHQTLSNPLEFEHWEQGPDGWAAIMNHLAARLLTELLHKEANLEVSGRFLK